MSIKKAEDNLWKEIVNNVDYENTKMIEKAIIKLKGECRRVYSS